MTKLDFRRFAGLVLFLSASLNPDVSISETALPLIQPPLSHLDEGVGTKLTTEQLNTIQPWAENTKSRLEELKLQVIGLPKKDREAQIVAGLDRIVKSSSPIESETYMRFVLNRALKIREVLTREALAPQEPDQWLCLRLLETSMELALSFYGNSAGGNQSMAPADFGRAYFSFLSGLSKSVFDASTQYQIERLIVGFLQWDLYRDDNRISYAVEIRRLNDLFTRLPETAPQSDVGSLNYVRQIKRLLGQLKSTGTLSSSVPASQLPQAPPELTPESFLYCDIEPGTANEINQALSQSPQITKSNFENYTAEKGDLVFYGDRSKRCGKVFPLRVRRVVYNGLIGPVLEYKMEHPWDSDNLVYNLSRRDSNIFFPKTCIDVEETKYCAGDMVYSIVQKKLRPTQYNKAVILGINVNNHLLLGWLEGQLKGEITTMSPDWARLASTSKTSDKLRIGTDVNILGDSNFFRIVARTPDDNFILESLGPQKVGQLVSEPRDHIVISNVPSDRIFPRR